MNKAFRKICVISCVTMAFVATSCSDNEPENSVITDFSLVEANYKDSGEWVDKLNPDVMGFDCLGVRFSHSATVSEWGSYWSGFVLTRSKDLTDYSQSTDDSWINHDCTSMSGGGIVGVGTPYVVGYWNSSEGIEPESPSLKIEMADASAFEAEYVWVNNTSYTYYAIKDGTPWSKTFAAGDWYKVEFYGVTTEGTVVGPVEQYLADYRADSDVNHYIIKDWTVVNLLPLNAKGSLKYIYLQMQSSDVGQWGINTPTYVALDRLKIVKK